MVSLDGVVTPFLEGVGPELVCEADPPPLLAHVEEDAVPVLPDQPHGEVELVAAVAPPRPEDVPGEALGVDPDEGVVGGGVSGDEGEVALAVDEALVSDGDKVALIRREADLSDPSHQFLAPHPPLDQPVDGEHLDAVLFCETLQLRKPRHRPVLGHHLADDGRRVQSCHPRQIDGGLGVARPAEDAPLLGPQREGVARHDEVV